MRSALGGRRSPEPMECTRKNEFEQRSQREGDCVQTTRKADPSTKIIMLGTGTPGPDPDRSGPATAIVVNDTPYLIDFGPGVVRRASAAFLDKGIKALEPTK